MPRLNIKNEVDGWDLKVPFAGDKVSIGSEATNTICLQGKGVAPRHLLLFKSHGGFQLRSLAGPGQLQIAGADVNEDVALEEGTEFNFGPYTIMFSGESVAPRSKPSRETRVPALEPSARRVESAPEPVEEEDAAAEAEDLVVREESFEDAPEPAEPAQTDSRTQAPAEPPSSVTSVLERMGHASKSTENAREDERRRNPRVQMASVNWEMKPAGLLNSLSRNNELSIRIVDLSQTGVKVVCQSLIDKKLEYSIKINHPKLGPVSVAARVMWHERFEHRTNYGEQMAGMVAGLRFCSESKKQRELVRDLMEKKNKSKDTLKVKYR